MPMDGLRKPLFWIAAALAFVVVLIDVGADSLLGKIQATTAQLDSMVEQNVSDDDDVDKDDLKHEVRRMNAKADPPGIGIKYLALVDGLLLYAMILMGLSLLLTQGLSGKLQVVLSFIVSIVTIIGSFVMLLVALELLLLMVGLFLAAPFGTIAYLALFGFFNRGGAAATLGLTLTLKLVSGGLLVFAHPTFLKNKGLVILFLMTVVAGLLLAFLHGFVPIILVSITDALGALITSVLALIWALFMLIFAIVAVIKGIF